MTASVEQHPTPLRVIDSHHYTGLTVNETKCKIQASIRKINPITTTYTTKRSQLTSTTNERDLGVWISSDLMWNKRVNDQCAKANNELRTNYFLHCKNASQH